MITGNGEPFGDLGLGAGLRRESSLSQGAGVSQVRGPKRVGAGNIREESLAIDSCLEVDAHLPWANHEFSLDRKAGVSTELGNNGVDRVVAEEDSTEGVAANSVMD
jgi:hypothetical protein